MKSTGAYDCLMIPGPLKAADSAHVKGGSQCGGVGGLVSAASGTTSTTVCCKLQIIYSLPFDSFACVRGAVHTTPTSQLFPWD